MRDDHEALRQKIVALERAKDDAERSARELRDKALRADAAEAQVRRLEAEVARLDAAIRPGVQTARLRALVLGLAVVILGGTAVLALLQRHALELGQARDELEGVRARLAEAETRFSVEREEGDAERARDAAELARLRDERERLGAQLEAQQTAASARQLRHGFAPLVYEARVVDVVGEAPVQRGTRCTVAVSPASGECRAQILCGALELYPHPGRGGYFACEVDERGFVGGQDVNTSDVSGDPALSIVQSEHSAIVREGPPNSWALTLSLRVP